MPKQKSIDIPSFYDHSNDTITRDITIREWCGLTNVALSTAYVQISEGELETYKVGRTRRIKCRSANSVRGGQTITDAAA